MSEIPEEVINEIIFHLPVKSILKFRCVCHSWLSFIDSPEFIKTQLSYAKAKIIISDSSSLQTTLYTLDIDILNPKPTAEISVFELKPSTLLQLILGSCNGLILLDHGGRGVYLRNPYTKSFHKIPYYVDLELTESVINKVVYGLGYDKLTDDYKVIRNVQFFNRLEKEYHSSAHVYSLKMNSWKKVDPFPYYVLSYDGFLAGGALHFLVCTSIRELYRLILAFDLATEEYRLVQQPIYSSGDFELNVDELGGCLVAMYNNYSMKYMDLWVMKEYGVVESWSKVFSLRDADIGVNLSGYVKPLIYSECGKKVLMQRGPETLLWYDLEKKSVESVEVGGRQLPEMFKSFVLLESLVQLTCRGTWDLKRGALQVK